MKVTDDHWLEGAKREVIPGGSNMPIRRCLVIHYTAGATGISSINHWRQLNNGICAHLVIDRDGAIYQCRPFNRTCGHAGVSRWIDPNTGKKYSGLNSCSIGIELANGGDNPSLISRYSVLPPVKAAHRNGGKVKPWEAYPQAQLAALEGVAKLLVARYNLDDITGHDCIAPERKVDPGPAFPMERLRRACGFAGLPTVHY